MYRIPHVNVEVIVDFENGNAELPYTSGSLYNKSSPPPSGSSDPDNKITIWQIGGNSITINEGDNSITFKDNSKSIIQLEGNGNITINAEANLNLYALKGEINLHSPTINIGDEGKVPDLTNIHGQNIHIHASKKLELLSDVNLNAEGTMTNLKGATTTVEGTTKTDVKGGVVSIAGTGLTEVKGGIVKVN